MKAKSTFLLFAMFVSLVLFQSAKANTGGIFKGKLLNAAGKPCPHIELELVPINAEQKSKDKRLWTITSTGGFFTFINVPQGKYTLSVNFNENPTNTSPYLTYFYPHTPKRSDAEIFEVTDNSNFSRLLFRLPESKKMKRFTGKIVWEDGEPVEDALVSLVDLEAQSDTGFGNTKSDANGVFKITGFIGRKYQIAAILFDGDLIKDSNPQLLAQGFSKMFYLDTKTNIIKITLTRPETDDETNNSLVGNLIIK